ncbi:MAG: hypothetical protein U5L07_17615 [Desulfobacterales bacterium]|nr:hypothetical protein [Desulfobacterales bacterium]
MAQVEIDLEKASKEQLLYANVLEKGMYLGLLALLITFVIYVTGIMPLRIPMEELPKYWQMSSSDYLQIAGIESGWGWAKLLGYGDFLNFLGIAFLAAVTIICYIAIIPTLVKKNDYVYATLAGIEAAVLLLAASGLLAAGH